GQVLCVCTSSCVCDICHTLRGTRAANRVAGGGNRWGRLYVIKVQIILQLRCRRSGWRLPRTEARSAALRIDPHSRRVHNWPRSSPTRKQGMSATRMAIGALAALLVTVPAGAQQRGRGRPGNSTTDTATSDTTITQTTPRGVVQSAQTI